MTREEQIIKASQLYAKAQQKPFMDGARWADRHPTAEWLDKACKIIDAYLDRVRKDIAYTNKEFIKDFKQAMKKQQ